MVHPRQKPGSLSVLNNYVHDDHAAAAELIFSEEGGSTLEMPAAYQHDIGADTVIFVNVPDDVETAPQHRRLSYTAPHCIWHCHSWAKLHVTCMCALL